MLQKYQIQEYMDASNLKKENKYSEIKPKMVRGTKRI